MLNRGSEWRRWEPHIHAPSTAMNNQFTGAIAWHDYLTALEQATPLIEAIAVTDYWGNPNIRATSRHLKNMSIILSVISLFIYSGSMANYEIEKSKFLNIQKSFVNLIDSIFISAS